MRTASTSPGTGIRAAVVDDDDLLRLLIARMLTEAGVEAISYPAADDAWCDLTLGSRPVDLVVTDVDMPGELDGIRFATCLAHAFEGVRVIVMSGCAESLQRAREIAGVVGILEKPFAPGRLLELAFG